MSKLYDYWENQSSFYDGKLNSFVSSDDLTFTGRIMFNDKKAKLTGRIKMNNVPQNNSYPFLRSMSDFSLNYALSPAFRLALSQGGNRTSLESDSVIFTQGQNNLTLLTKIRNELVEKVSNWPISATLRYHLGNHTLISAGVEDLDFTKEKYGGMIKAYALHGKALDNGIKLYGGVCGGYSLLDKMCKFTNFVLSLKNGTFNSLLNMSFIKKKDPNLCNPSSSEEQTKKGCCCLKDCDKVISVKADNKITQKLTLGGDTEFNITNKEVKSRFFALYDIEPDTAVKARWEDKDKSVTMTVNHNFRGLLNFAVTGKFSAVKKSDFAIQSKLIPFTSKLGMSIEVNETLI